MFIKRKWARMGSDRKLYLKVCSVVLMAILVLFFHSWNRKQHLKLKQKAAMLDVDVQELIQTGQENKNIDTYSVTEVKDLADSVLKVKKHLKSKPSANKKPSNEDSVFPEAMKKWYETNQTSNILLLSSGRSGGAFLGQLLNDMFPDTFYAFLPTIKAALYKNPQQIDDKVTTNEFLDEVVAKLKYKDNGAISGLINDLFQCNFNEPLSLSRSYAYSIPRFSSPNNHIFKFCMKIRLSMQMCLRPKILGEVCETFPKRLIMEQNFEIEDVEKFLTNNDVSTKSVFKVVLFVRDPRAVTNSREFLHHCDSSSMNGCVDVTKLCDRLDAEVSTVMHLGNKYPKNVVLLRYEDLCLDPYGTVDKLVKFLNFTPIPELINQFVQAHTGQTRAGKFLNVPKEIHDNPVSTVKNSSIKPFDWKPKISNTLLQAVENKCEKSMEVLGYAKWHKDNDKILIKNAIEVWPFS